MKDKVIMAEMKNQPEEIYLNLGDDVDCLDYNELVESEIGWSKKPCTTDALRYVRADLKDEEAGTINLRDQFAMAALTGLLSNSGGVIQFNSMNGTGYANGDSEGVASWAYELADAMLKERDK